jgi:hypothetical protein
MRRNGRDPIYQDSIEGDPTHQTEEKGLFCRFFIQHEKKRDEGDPAQNGKIKFGECQSCQCAAQERQ